MDNLNQIEELKAELDTVFSQMYDVANSISQLKPVYYQSNSRFSWNGGVIGAILEAREDNRIKKILNNVIYQGKTFGEIPGYLFKLVEDCVSIQQRIQTLIVDKENEIYYGNVENIKTAAMACYSAWNNYSDVSSLEYDGSFLFLKVREEIDREIAKIDKPVEEDKILQDNNFKSSGCFGFVLMLIIASSLLGFVLL
jgi:hypothetical protein